MTQSPPATAEVLVAAADPVTADFTRCLSIMSGCRASWDCYDRSSAEKAAGDRAEAQALSQAGTIWRENPAMHDALRAAFASARPMATITEIERAAALQASGGGE